MEEAKNRNLYADLGLTDSWASLGEIDLAHMELTSKLDPEVNPEAAPDDAAELSKVKSAYKILRDPQKRAEYNRIRTDLFKHKRPSAIWRKHKTGWKSPLDQVLRVARMQLMSKAWQRAQTKRLPRNAQLRAQAQLRAHANHLDLFHALSESHGGAAALRHVGLGPVEEVPQYWAVFDLAYEHGKTMREEKHQQTRKEAMEREWAERITRVSDIKEDEYFRRRAAAYEQRDRADEVKWINQEAEDSILSLARMAQHDLGDDEEDVRQKVQKAEDLLDFLWDKTYSGTWAVPGIKEGLDLGLILRSVLQPKSVKSWPFKPHIQDIAAILLHKVPDKGN